MLFCWFCICLLFWGCVCFVMLVFWIVIILWFTLIFNFNDVDVCCGVVCYLVFTFCVCCDMLLFILDVLWGRCVEFCLCLLWGGFDCLLVRFWFVCGALECGFVFWWCIYLIWVTVLIVCLSFMIWVVDLFWFCLSGVVCLIVLIFRCYFGFVLTLFVYLCCLAGCLVLCFVGFVRCFAFRVLRASGLCWF